LRDLKGRGMTYREIADIFGCSREWVRRLADKWDVPSQCKKCGKPCRARNKWCDECGAEKRVADARKCMKRKLKSFGSRPVVMEAYRFFADLGLDVVLNAEANRNEAELLVNGHAVKCNVMVPVSRGHQCRLRPVPGAEWIFLTDGNMNMGFLIPSPEVVKKQTYIGEKSEWHQYEMDAWGPDGIREVLAQ